MRLSKHRIVACLMLLSMLTASLAGAQGIEGLFEGAGTTGDRPGASSGATSGNGTPPKSVWDTLPGYTRPDPSMPETSPGDAAPGGTFPEAPAPAAPAQPGTPDRGTSQSSTPIRDVSILNAVGKPLQSVPAAFTPGENYEVYAGPGTQYVRPANNKAYVSTNDWIRVYGSDGDWLLIEYELNSGPWRRGYITSRALPAGYQVSAIEKQGTSMRVTRQCDMTDDPYNKQQAIATLSAGAQVTFLHYDGVWAYIEAQTAGGLMRGYVGIGDVE